MAPRIVWLTAAADKVEEELVAPLASELRQVFPKATAITVYDCFGGYSQNHAERIVLGVEVRGGNDYRTHVVKIGDRRSAASDYDGWRRCVLRRNFSSRILVSLSRRLLPGGRIAIVYEDAHRFFGSPEEGQGPISLESAVFSAVLDDKPRAVSVERVVRQIYTDLYRWFYRGAKPGTAAAIRFYRARLRRALTPWKEQAWRVGLRRDIIWLLCGRDRPDAPLPCSYIDAADYVEWAIKSGNVPQTLVGRSHGDLHGRNVYVGVQREEAEYPAVFDYGHMGGSNVVVWDFVKLETELKVRLLMPLFHDPDCRRSIEHATRGVSTDTAAQASPDRPSAEMDTRTLRLAQLLFAWRFEYLLNILSERVNQISDPESPDPPGGRNVTGNQRLDRALCLLLRIRQEAALFLGDRQPQRGKRALWRDEYGFALAVYGLCTAKYDYKASESAFAAISAGVAAASTTSAARAIRAGLAAGAASTDHHPSYRVPLAIAHHIWKSSRSRSSVLRGIGILERASHRYPHAVPLLQEYALMLSEAGRQEAALSLLKPIEELGIVFRDEETLCRLGRTCKDLGDRALFDNPVPAPEVSSHPAWQWYRTSYGHYLEAFEGGGRYYPGINAATMALLCGYRDKSVELAGRTLEICRELDLAALPADGRFWALVTQGEAMVLGGSCDKAAEFYRQALANLPRGDAGLAQSAYGQVCRLAWALGPAVCPVLDEFRTVRRRFRNTDSSRSFCNAAFRNAAGKTA
ncbi:MAG: hypothetical protein FJ224_05095 [Lentisphaerae bacterium]|nr:hypothetical protein [Lentisphaerota bacterium]